MRRKRHWKYMEDENCATLLLFWPRIVKKKGFLMIFKIFVAKERSSRPGRLRLGRNCNRIRRRESAAWKRACCTCGIDGGGRPGRPAIRNREGNKRRPSLRKDIFWPLNRRWAWAGPGRRWGALCPSAARWRWREAAGTCRSNNNLWPFLLPSAARGPAYSLSWRRASLRRCWTSTAAPETNS